MKSIIVQKFGGSSVADLQKIQAVADKVIATAERGYEVVVVVSAMGDTTDELLQMARQLTDSPSRRELDMLLSVGERISMTLLSMAIHDRGLHAISLTGSQCGIITTDSHSNARIMDVRPFRVQDELSKGNIVIVAGYQGTSYRREVTTLGRGGSDTTAVALAAALGAEACEIYSDVDGVYSADPRVVLDAEQLESLTHDEMMEMARAGAKVLNEQAVEFAKRSKIALYAKSTHKADSKGTLIRPDGFNERAERAEQNLPTVAIAHLHTGLFVVGHGENADRVLAIVQDLECVVCEWDPGASCEIFLSTENIHDLPSLERELQELDAETASMGLVSAIGDGVGSRPRWVLHAATVLEEASIHPRAIFVSRARLSLVLPSASVEEGARLLHGAFR